jgi:signal transduction histidine kinase
MKSIGTKLATLYALSATLTLAGAFAIGYVLLEHRLVHGLDLLNQAEFEQISARLGDQLGAMTPQEIDQRIRQTTEYASVLFYVNLHDKVTRDLFYSSNLNRQLIPDVPGKHIYDAVVPEIGELRVSEFTLHGLDVTVGTPLKPIRSELRIYFEVCLVLLIVAIFVSVAIGMALSRVVLTPLRAISTTARRIRDDNLGERIPVADVHDELSELARLLNHTFDRLESSFSRIRRFAADASHELKTPLSLLRLHAEKLVTDGHLEIDHEEVILVMLDELVHLNRLIDQLLFLSRVEAKALSLRVVPHDPERFLKLFEQDARVLAEHQGKRFVLLHSGNREVAFQGDLLRQVLLNLLSNAIAASPSGGVVTLRSEFVRDWWRVSIEDDGPGVSAEQRERMFEPFVRLGRGKDAEPGTGLGLAISRTIIDLHRGRIYACEGPDGKGLKVTFELFAGSTRRVDDVAVPGTPTSQPSFGKPATPS